LRGNRQKSKEKPHANSAGDVPATWADVDDLINNIGYRPDTDIGKGVALFVDWYREYYS
jgi:UDP-glucuronate 4-epimerase